jgi:hypothetical protein
MASPFKVFRRHQKEALAVLGVMIMLAFTVGPIITSMNKGASRADPVVVTSQYGDLRDSDFWQLRRQHSVAVGFLSRALAEVGPEQASPQWYAYTSQMIKMYAPGLPKEQIDGFVRQQWINQVQSVVEREFGPSTERALADNWLLAKRARELGIVVSDKAVVDALRERVAGLSEDKVRQIIESTGVGQQQLVEAFRSQMLAQRMRQMFQLSLYGSTPAERFEDYEKLHRQATIEVAPISVASFVAKVADPDEKTLREYFDRYKDRAHDPSSPEPGFREPYRTTVEYFKADYEKFVDPKAVTDEQIAKYYEEHKSEYIKRELPKPEEPAKPAPKPEAKAPPQPPKEAAKPAPAKPAAPAPAPKASVPAKPAETKAAKPAETKAAKPAEKPQDKPATKPAEKPADKPKDKPAAKSAEKPAEKPKDQAKGKTSMWRSARVHLAAFEKEKEQKPAKPADAAKPAAPAKAVETKPAAPAKPAEAKPQTPAAKPAAAPAAKAEPPVQYTPLAEVRDQIRDRLAREQASKKMRSMLEPIRDQLRRYSAQLARAKGKNEELPKFDAATVAKENNLTVKRLEMVSQDEVGGADIAGSRTTDQQTFEQHVFRAPGLGRPAVSQDLQGNMYLFWKADESKEHVPKFEDPGIRARVLAAWKTGQAFELAKAEANRLAEKARKSKTPLKESLKQDGVKVLEPKPFSWLTRGSVPNEMSDQPPQFSRVEGVDAAGEKFMRSVFTAEPGTVNVAPNRPQTEVYVIRVDQFSPSMNVLWELFIHEDYGRYAMAAFPRQQALYQSWIQEIKDRAAFQWQRTPDQRDESEGPVGPAEPIEAPQF